MTALFLMSKLQLGEETAAVCIINDYRVCM